MTGWDGELHACAVCCETYEEQDSLQNPSSAPEMVDTGRIPSCRRRCRSMSVEWVYGLLKQRAKGQLPCEHSCTPCRACYQCAEQCEQTGLL